MNPEEIFYLCPTCFEASETALEGHEHPMMRCELGRPGDGSQRTSHLARAALVLGNAADAVAYGACSTVKAKA